MASAGEILDPRRPCLEGRSHGRAQVEKIVTKSGERRYPGIFRITVSGEARGYIVFYRVRGLGQRSKNFDRLADAVEFQAQSRGRDWQRSQRQRTRSKVTVEEYFWQWLQSSGRVVVVSPGHPDIGDGADYGFFVHRLTSTGQWDPSFVAPVLRLPNMYSQDVAASHSLSRIVVVGTQYVARYLG